MAKSKDHKRDEDLEGEIRQLKAEIRQLQRQLKYYQKRDHLTEKIAEDLVEVLQEEKKARKCQECGKGELNEVIIASRQITTCNMCGWRSLAKKL